MVRKEEVHKVVREGYAEIARQSGSCCCGGGTNKAQTISQKIGYSNKDIQSVPEGANLGLGCGNPVALASLKKGEVVLDLGSGAGFDCFLASARVGASGKIIGVDMTPEMLEKARANASQDKYKNVEFRLGEIENLPVADNFVDVIISNCVINLASDKKQVFREAFRVLKPSGRLMVSDIVLLKELPDYVRSSIAAYVGCVSGALKKNEYLKAIKTAGFKDVKVVEETIFPLDCMLNDSTAKKTIENLNMTQEQLKEISASIASIKVYGVK